MSKDFFVHETAIVEDNVKIGTGTKVWHFSHILSNVEVGRSCSIGQNVVIGPNVKVGSNCKIQNNVSLYDGLFAEDDVFFGPSCVFTNVINPRAAIERKSEFRKTIIRKGSTIGANATIVCGVELGMYCMVGAGAVVTKDVEPYSVVIGNPARHYRWVSRDGFMLDEDLKCPESGDKYYLKNGKLERL
jgi:UDP-2-acetamido-3-amino-2,3-dideoxy-glucuronate N-acetyltransferase